LHDRHPASATVPLNHDPAIDFASVQICRPGDRGSRRAVGRKIMKTDSNLGAQAIVGYVRRNPCPWGRAFISVRHVAPSCHYGSISPGLLQELRPWRCVRCSIAVRASRRRFKSFRPGDYLVRLRRHRQARRYTLRIDAASRVVLTIRRAA
jgi:hypothetical protein